MTSSAKARVLLSLPWVVTGGVDASAIELARVLFAAGHRLALATHVAAAHVWAPRLRPVLDDHFLLGELCAPARHAEALVAAARSFGADVLFLSHSWPGLECLPLLKRTLPHVRVVDLLHMDDPRPGAQYAQTACEKFDRLIDLHLCASQFVRKRALAWGAGAEKLSTLYLGCDEEGACKPANVPFGHLRGALGLPIPLGARVIGFVGRMAFEKDPVFVVRTYAALGRALTAAGGREPHFVLVGGGPLLEEARAEALALGIGSRTHFLPPDVDVPRVLRDLSLLLMASRLEGLPLVFFEALALETPVVTTAVQGIPELVDGEVGACVAEGGEEAARLRALVDAALPLLLDEPRRLEAGRAGRKRVRERFSTAARQRGMLEGFSGPAPR